MEFNDNMLECVDKFSDEILAQDEIDVDNDIAICQAKATGRCESCFICVHGEIGRRANSLAIVVGIP